jgi:hypothetical protein
VAEDALVQVVERIRDEIGELWTHLRFGFFYGVKFL